MRYCLLLGCISLLGCIPSAAPQPRGLTASEFRDGMRDFKRDVTDPIAQDVTELTRSQGDQAGRLQTVEDLMRNPPPYREDLDDGPTDEERLAREEEESMSDVERRRYDRKAMRERKKREEAEMYLELEEAKADELQRRLKRRERVERMHEDDRIYGRVPGHFWYDDPPPPTYFVEPTPLPNYPGDQRGYVYPRQPAPLPPSWLLPKDWKKQAGLLEVEDSSYLSNRRRTSRPIGL